MSRGIPTIGVRGIRFRSRIEAQWAYIFEEFGWNWEYEPIDLNGYIPDFIITFNNGDELLIEVKGEMNIWDKSSDYVKKIYESGWEGYYLVVGANYKICDTKEEFDIPVGSKIGDIFLYDLYKDNLEFGYTSENFDIYFFRSKIILIGIIGTITESSRDSNMMVPYINTKTISDMDYAYLYGCYNNYRIICTGYGFGDDKYIHIFRRYLDLDNFKSIWTRAKNSVQWKR